MTPRVPRLAPTLTREISGGKGRLFDLERLLRDGLPPIDLSVVGRAGATVVIAPGNASAQSKAIADLVMDGTDDQAEIIDAHKLLPPPGGSILILEGDVYLSATAVFPEADPMPNVELFGRGAATIVHFDRWIDAIVLGPGARVHHLTFKANASTSTTTVAAASDGQNISGDSPFSPFTLEVESTDGFPEPGSGASLRVTVDELFGYQLVSYTGKTSTSFTGCSGFFGGTKTTHEGFDVRVADANGNGVNLSGGFDVTRGSTVEKCAFADCGIFTSTPGTRILDNSFTGRTLYPIYLSERGGVVQGNVFLDFFAAYEPGDPSSSAGSIVYAASDNATIVGNMILGGGSQWAIYWAGNQIVASENVIVEHELLVPNSGVLYVAGSAGICTGNVIYGATVEDALDGFPVVIYGASSGPIADNFVFDCVGFICGLYPTSSDQTVSGNIVEGSYGVGIYSGDVVVGNRVSIQLLPALADGYSAGIYAAYHVVGNYVVVTRDEESEGEARGGIADSDVAEANYVEAFDVAAIAGCRAIVGNVLLNSSANGWIEAQIGAVEVIDGNVCNRATNIIGTGFSTGSVLMMIRDNKLAGNGALAAGPAIDLSGMSGSGQRVIVVGNDVRRSSAYLADPGGLAEVNLDGSANDWNIV